jgi:hypothetical protein
MDGIGIFQVLASPFNWLGLFIGAALFVVVFPRRNLGIIGWLIALCLNIPTLISMSKRGDDPVGLVDFLTLVGFGGFALGAVIGMIIRTVRERA